MSQSGRSGALMSTLPVVSLSCQLIQSVGKRSRVSLHDGRDDRSVHLGDCGLLDGIRPNGGFVEHGQQGEDSTAQVMLEGLHDPFRVDGALGVRQNKLESVACERDLTSTRFPRETILD